MGCEPCEEVKSAGPLKTVLDTRGSILAPGEEFSVSVVNAASDAGFNRFEREGVEDAPTAIIKAGGKRQVCTLIAVKGKDGHNVVKLDCERPTDLKDFKPIKAGAKDKGDKDDED